MGDDMSKRDTGLVVGFGGICRNSIVGVLLFIRVGSRGGRGPFGRGGWGAQSFDGALFS